MMAATIQTMDMEKVLEAIIFVASKVTEPTFHKISKMFWYADKLHLERYGFALSEDTYYAMGNGPVPSRIYDVMKVAAGTKNAVLGVDTTVIREALGVKTDAKTLIAKRESNVDFLSELEVECLVDAMSKHGKKSFAQLSAETHDAAWQSVPRNAAIPFREIVKTLPNAQELQSFLYT
jgi:uncharacterized phage-associated protein